MLREIRTGPLIRSRRAAIQQQVFGWTEPPDLSVGHRVGRHRRDDRFYARWAAEYVDALTRSANPVAERAGGELTPRAIDLLREG